jgi:hypothetical protein
MAEYSKTSPYFRTSQSSGYLDIISFVNLTEETDDILYEVPKNYEYRPDLLAYDIYGDVGYWWVFAVRNKSIIKDPVFDLESGLQIYIPKLVSIKRALGL